MQLLATDEAGLHLYSDDTDSTSLQNFTLSINKFELSQLMKVLPLHHAFRANLMATITLFKLHLA